MAKSKNRKRGGQTGCRFLLATGLVSLILLAINVWIVKSFGQPLFEGFDSRLFQATQFVFPIIMIFLEFWMFDKIIARKTS